MKGLLAKDYGLIKKQKNFFILVVIMLTFFCFTDSATMSFTMGYTIAVFLMLVVTTISYDEMERGLSFLLAMPVSRKSYVLEKYLLGGVLGLAAFFLSSAINFVFIFARTGMFPYKMWLQQGMWIFGFMVLFLGIMLPIQLKFGTEKGRIILFLSFMIFFGIGYLVLDYPEGLQSEFKAILTFLSSGIHAEIALLAADILILLVSYSISRHIMEHKEL